MESCPEQVKVLNARINEQNQIIVSILPSFPTKYVLAEDSVDKLISNLPGIYRLAINLPEEKYKIFNSAFRSMTRLIMQRNAAHIKKYFPSRTASTASTAQNVAQLQEEGKLPLVAVYVLGLQHLKQTDKDEDFSLEIFYKEIAKHRTIVLIPKVGAESTT